MSRENRQDGETPSRAQRCKGDAFRISPLAFTSWEGAEKRRSPSQKTGLTA
jgi:hypothetical protein